MALGPTSRALQDQSTETRAAVATSIRRALQPYQRDKQVALAGAIWLVAAISIPFAWLVWYVGPQMEMVRPVLASISDPALRAALQEAHAERLGLWVAVWPVTLLVLSQILKWKMEE